QRPVDYQHRADPLNRSPLPRGLGGILPSKAVDQQRQPPPLGHPGHIAADANGILQQRRDDLEILATLGPQPQRLFGTVLESRVLGHAAARTRSMDAPQAVNFSSSRS